MKYKQNYLGIWLPIPDEIDNYAQNEFGIWLPKEFQYPHCPHSDWHQLSDKDYSARREIIARPPMAMITWN